MPCQSNPGVRLGGLDPSRSSKGKYSVVASLTRRSDRWWTEIASPKWALMTRGGPGRGRSQAHLGVDIPHNEGHLTSTNCFSVVAADLSSTFIVGDQLAGPRATCCMPRTEMMCARCCSHIPGYSLAPFLRGDLARIWQGRGGAQVHA